MKELTLDHLENLAIGSAILGSGGGGDPTYFYMMARYEMERHGPVSLIGINDLNNDDLVLPVGFMGAPVAETEKIPSGREFFDVVNTLEKILEKKIDVVMPFEIGGMNAFIPVIVAAQNRIPLLDADLMGRAFPEGQMTVCNLAGVNPSPGVVADSLGNTVIIHANDSHTLEKFGRQVTIAMGSIGAFGYYPFLGLQAETFTISKSISKAIAIGKLHREAQKKEESPLDAILKLCKGVHLGSGKVVDIDRVISKGFVYGKIVIEHQKDMIEIVFQNEFLIAKLNEQIVATTPDILVLFEQETAVPIMCESLQYGIKVNLVALPAPEIWTTPAGLALVGPRHFGYNVDYQSVEKGKIEESYEKINH